MDPRLREDDESLNLEGKINFIQRSHFVLNGNLFLSFIKSFVTSLPLIKKLLQFDVACFSSGLALNFWLRIGWLGLLFFVIFFPLQKKPLS